MNMDKDWNGTGENKNSGFDRRVGLVDDSFSF